MPSCLREDATLASLLLPRLSKSFLAHRQTLRLGFQSLLVPTVHQRLSAQWAGIETISYRLHSHPLIQLNYYTP